jgi:hypothetical protein
MMKRGIFAAAVFAALIAAGSAHAGPREDVLSGAIRCGGVSQDRQWLDCYYGAAQPMRASLRLTPASQAQQALAAAAGTGGAMGGVRQDVLSGAIRCGGVADDRQWLDCYYGAAQPMRASLGLAPAPQAQQAMTRPVASAPANAPLPPAPYAPLPPAPYAQAASAAPPQQPAVRRRMPASPGFIDGLFGDDPVVTTGRITALTTNKLGYFTATLDNGQVWEQTSGDIPNWRKDPTNFNVTVTRGMMRTFNFRVEGDPHHYKVKPGRPS